IVTISVSAWTPRSPVSHLRIESRRLPIVRLAMMVSSASASHGYLGVSNCGSFVANADRVAAVLMPSNAVTPAANRTNRRRSMLCPRRQAFEGAYAVRNEMERLTFRREDRHLRAAID